MIFNRKTLFAGLKTALKPTGFNDRQVTSIGVIVDEFERRKLADVRWLAYILATVWHEAWFISQREIGRGKGKKYGVPHKLTGKVYYGRGFSQLTWYDNYLKFQNTLNLPLTTDPDMALVVPVGVAILFEGMTTGVTAKDSFTKYQLHDFFNDDVDDPVGARRIINGTDKAKLIAGYHYDILLVLEAAKRPDPVQSQADADEQTYRTDDPELLSKPVRPGHGGGAAVGGAGAAVVVGAAAAQKGWPWELILMWGGIAAFVVVIAVLVWRARQ